MKSFTKSYVSKTWDELSSSEQNYIMDYIMKNDPEFYQTIDEIEYGKFLQKLNECIKKNKTFKIETLYSEDNPNFKNGIEIVDFIDFAYIGYDYITVNNEYVVYIDDIDASVDPNNLTMDDVHFAFKMIRDTPAAMNKYISIMSGNYNKKKVKELFESVKMKYDSFVAELYDIIYEYDKFMNTPNKDVVRTIMTNYEFIYDENGNFIEYKNM